MDVRIFVEPQQGATYDQLLNVARAAESLGYGAFFRSDHYLAMDTEGLPGSTDAWITLAGLARDTSRIRLGTLVTAATFRLPGPLAIAVAQVDAMSEGRVELGLGAAWYAEEHTAYGIPFPPVKERFDRLEEQLAIITGLWRTPVGEKFFFDGRHYQLADSPALPKPTQRPGPPVIVGGRGRQRTPELAARFADEYNIAFQSLEDSAAAFARVDAACQAIGREMAPVSSVAQVVCCGEGAGQLRARADATGRDLDDLRANGLAGSPDQVVERIGRFASIGVTRLYLQVLDLTDLDHLELLAAKVVPQV
jgi:F420-dependent oxidoreductase-like protein